MRSITFYLLIFSASVCLNLLPASFAEPTGESLTIHFTGMDPHVGQNLYIRLIDKSTLKETGRNSMMITSADFDMVVNGNYTGGSFFIDFFADLNQNGLYDIPPVDHAWRLELDNAVGNDELNFEHNLAFTDIEWRYMLTVQFSGMTPHVGQLLELRVENDVNSKEVGRTRIESIPSSDFEINITGLELNTEYKVEFYADLNGNGLYDEPPADHAWELNFENNSGDVVLPFAHNINFTDIGWKYLFTLNLTNMEPHFGQLFELRVYNSDDFFDEVGRFTLPAILVSNFKVFIPQIEIDHDYTVDFYADLNGNGVYNAPPEDHAWRLNFNSSTGDFVMDFAHNINFTDIMWPSATAVNVSDLVPEEYTLFQNYPNPFNPTTTIRFNLPVPANVEIKIFNVLGSEIKTLIYRNFSAGDHEVVFDASGLASGVYYYKLSTEGFSETRKMLLLR